jgi:CopG family nickel-responsive transcriptional regulator
MRRITLSLDEELARQFDSWAQRHGYGQRSEAFRDLLRERLEREAIEVAQGLCVGSLSYVYNHHERHLAERLTVQQHDNHALCLSTVHVHLDHEHCLEVQLLRGPIAGVRRYADAVIAERGVRHGHLHLVPVRETPEQHGHAHLTPAV